MRLIVEDKPTELSHIGIPTGRCMHEQSSAHAVKQAPSDSQSQTGPYLMQKRAGRDLFLGGYSTTVPHVHVELQLMKIFLPLLLIFVSGEWYLLTESFLVLNDYSIVLRTSLVPMLPISAVCI